MPPEAAHRQGLRRGRQLARGLRGFPQDRQREPRACGEDLRRKGGVARQSKRSSSVRYRAAAWDARGYGDSEDYAGPLDFADLWRDLERVLDHLAAQRAHLVGLSMGGRIARDFALQRPHRVASLTLANSSPGYDALPPDAVQAYLDARRSSTLPSLRW
ncbi:MAG: alpha/beta fold hydrolase [Betaproteobacteria bacterium]|nr:alpha/beta fold hydrolase [Betaproteobacteria bacterium]